MGLHTRKQLSELLKLDWGNKSNRDKIGMWVKRGSIVEKDGLIDDTDPQNIYWIKKQSEKVPTASSKPEPQKETQGPKVEQPPLPENTKIKKQKKGTDQEAEVKWGLDIEKKELEIEKLRVDTRLQELKEEKIRGEVIPITLTKAIVTNLSQSILTSQKDFIDYLLIRIGKEAKLSGEQLAKLRGEMIKALNETVDKAIKTSQRNIKSLMYEFSIKKEVGEHD